MNTNADGRSTEVVVGIPEGLKHQSVINCDQLQVVRKSALTNYLGSLSPKNLTAVNTALKIALSL